MKVAITMQARTLGCAAGSRAEWLYVMPRAMRVERLAVQVVDAMDMTAPAERTVALSLADVDAPHLMRSMMHDREQWISAELLEHHDVDVVVYEGSRVSIEVVRTVTTRDQAVVLVTLLGDSR